MTHTAAHHRQLDQWAAIAAGEPAGHALLPSQDRLEGSQ